MGATDPWPSLLGSSAAIAALWLVVVGVLTALSLRRGRPPRRLVSSGAPWLALRRDGAGGRGRAWPSFTGRRARLWRWLLRVLAATSLVLALHPPGARRPREESLVLVDVSASMAARGSDGRSRLAVGIAAVAGKLRSGPPGLVSIAGFAQSVRPETGFVDKGAPAVAVALERLRPTSLAADPATAVGFAKSLLRQRPALRLLVVTDDPGPWDVLASSGALPAVDVLTVGEPADNVALVELGARRREHHPEAFEAWGRVVNHGAGPAELEVTVLAAGHVSTQELVLAPGASDVITLAGRSPLAVAVEAQLRAKTGDNALAADDRAFAALPAVARPRVLLVGPENLYLEAALLSLGPTLVLDRVDPAAASDEVLSSDPERVVILDRHTPPRSPDRGRFLYVAPTGSGSPVAQGGWVGHPIPTRVDRDHPLVANLSLVDLNIRRARHLRPDPGDQVVVASFATPLIVARARPNLRLVQVGFPIDASDLPLRPALPLLLGNVLAWLAGEPPSSSSTAYSVETTVKVPAPPGDEAKTPVLEAPDGSTRMFGPAIGAATTLAAADFERVAHHEIDAAQSTIDVLLPDPGFYRLFRPGAAGEARLLAATFAAPAESDLRPPFTSAGARPVRPTAGADTPFTAHLASGSAWLLLGLLLTVLDWSTRRSGEIR